MLDANKNYSAFLIVRAVYDNVLAMEHLINGLNTRRGRHPRPDRTLSKAIPVRLPSAMRAEIDGIREARLDQPEMSALIRELLAEALEARRRASVFDALPEPGLPCLPKPV